MVRKMGKASAASEGSFACMVPQVVHEVAVEVEGLGAPVALQGEHASVPA